MAKVKELVEDVRSVLIRITKLNLDEATPEELATISKFVKVSAVDNDEDLITLRNYWIGMKNESH